MSPEDKNRRNRANRALRQIQQSLGLSRRAAKRRLLAFLRQSLSPGLQMLARKRAGLSWYPEGYKLPKTAHVAYRGRVHA